MLPEYEIEQAICLIVFSHSLGGLALSCRFLLDMALVNAVFAETSCSIHPHEKRNGNEYLITELW